ncbi:hypothetical protein ACS0TY_012718 [Phlomoides rotata]
MGDNVFHIELRKWADIMVIAPLSANTLAKIAGGLCDNLLTCIVRAWDYSKPLFIAPAMNTLMWDNPFTERHLVVLDDLGMSLIPPVKKRLACGDYGNGAMAEPSLIYSTELILLFLVSEIVCKLHSRVVWNTAYHSLRFVVHKQTEVRNGPVAIVPSNDGNASVFMRTRWEDNLFGKLVSRKGLDS